MIPVRVVQASIDQIINMVPWGTASWPQPGPCRCASLCPEALVIEKVHVAFSLNGDMPAPRTVHVMLWVAPVGMVACFVEETQQQKGHSL